jgi:hypothetical protein
MNFLYAAYGATWLIHLLYLGVIVRRYTRVRRDLEELNRK